MKRFIFTLQSLYGVKLAVKKKQEIELAEAIRQVMTLERALEELRQEYMDKSQEFETFITNGSDPERLSHRAYYFAYLRERMKQVNAELATARELRMQRQQVLVTTMAEIKALDKLRETQYQEYLMELQKESDKEMDDFVSYQQVSNVNVG